MAERCTSSGSCVAGFLDCRPCPFDMDDYFSGDIDALQPIIDVAVSVPSAPLEDVLFEFDEIVSNEEITKIRAAVLARIAVKGEIDGKDI